jgi:hypothetical protein
MVKTLLAMLKDGLKAFLFWAVASGVLIYFFKYPGLIFSELLGLIFLAAFVATWGAQLLFWLLSLIGFARVRRPAALPPVAGGPNQSAGPGSAPNAQGRPCQPCGGSGRIGCSACFGARGRRERPQTAEGTGQWIPCSYCVGSGSV